MRSASRLLRRATAVRALVKATHAPPLAPAMLRAASERRIHTLCTHLSSSPIERDADKAPPRSSHVAFFSTGAGALRRRHLQASRFDSLALAAAGAAAGAASRASEEDLSVSQLQAILEESGVDTRTVFEKSELVSTLKAQKEVLPKSVRARLESLLSRTSAEAAPDSVPGGGLYQDEQSVVELFKVRPSPTQPTFSFLLNDAPFLQRCRASCVHIRTSAVSSLPFTQDETDLPSSGSGSGIVWDAQGHVVRIAAPAWSYTRGSFLFTSHSFAFLVDPQVTNFHVIRAARSASVTLSDNSTWDATLVGFEADKDIAVLKLGGRRPDGFGRGPSSDVGPGVSSSSSASLPRKGAPPAIQPIALGSSSGLQAGPIQSYFRIPNIY